MDMNPSMNQIPSPLKFHQKLAFASGNFLNVLAVSLWFPYNVAFFQNVLGLAPHNAGNIVLAGQIGGTFSTLFIGAWSDHCQCRIPGRRKVFQLLGVVSVSCVFIFLWNDCLGCQDVPEVYKVVYFSCFAIVFQFGWASTQIGQLALLPELTSEKKAQVELSSMRYAFSIIANIAIFACFWGLLVLLYPSSSIQTLSHHDKNLFMALSIIVVIVGVPASIPFQLFVPEKQGRTLKKLPWYKWLVNPKFYLTGICFTVSRYISLVPQTYMTFFFTVSLKMDKSSIAKGPLVLYISGFLATLIVKKCRNFVGDKMTYFLGLVFIWGALIFFWVKDPTDDADSHFNWSRDCIYIALVLLGAGGAILIVISLSMIAFLVGEYKGSSAFVYSCIMCSDRLANGVGVNIIQYFTPDQSQLQDFYRDVLVYLLLVTSFVGLLIMLAMRVTEMLPAYKRIKALKDKNNSYEAVDTFSINDNN